MVRCQIPVTKLRPLDQKASSTSAAGHKPTLVNQGHPFGPQPSPWPENQLDFRGPRRLHNACEPTSFVRPSAVILPTKTQVDTRGPRRVTTFAHHLPAVGQERHRPIAAGLFDPSSTSAPPTMTHNHHHNKPKRNAQCR